MLNTPEAIRKEATRTLNRLMPDIEANLEGLDDDFTRRLKEHFPEIFRLLYELYGAQYDFFFHLREIILNAVKMINQRPPDLKALDLEREENPFWYESEKMVGGVLYVDRFAENLWKLHSKIEYFQELGINYVHLMPLFKVPATNNDGGYAISDYRQVNPNIGTLAQLIDLAEMLRQSGISLAVDFVFNHTANEHEWAKQALEGDQRYQDFYYMFPDRTLPDEYEKNLREIFPENSPGNFTYIQEIDRWVWTTFNDFQWDLNYSNPDVFNAMLGELLFIINQGAEVIRLDAVAFIWKQMGTSCENLPNAHLIIQAYNRIVQVVAPATIFKSEAIVHPRDIAKYIRLDECQISYNPTLMALLWESIATRDTKLLRHSMNKHFALDEGCTWVNYVRVHDDIGWTFADEDALEVGINGFDHRQFLNQFYVGEFEGSFARGVSFNYNPENRDMRICGTAASLVGLEDALEKKDKRQTERALKRSLLIHSVIISVGGIPLIYLGDEIAMMNDYDYVLDEEKMHDSRWIHRPKFDWERAEKRDDPTTIAGYIFQNFKRLIAIRKTIPEFRDTNTLFFDTNNKQVLGYTRHRKILVLANFTEFAQTVDTQIFHAYLQADEQMVDLVSGNIVDTNNDITLDPYQFIWIRNYEESRQLLTPPENTFDQSDE